MISDRRNPYLILGVDFATGNAEARRNFARQAKRIRRQASSAYSVEDLTWALSEVEDHLAHPETSVDVYRVPADPSVFRPSTPGLLNPPPMTLPRITAPGDADAAERAALAAALVVLNASLIELGSLVDLPVAYEVEAAKLPPPVVAPEGPKP